MSQVMVWKSDADGKLFEDQVKYTNHLRSLARARNNIRKQKSVSDIREAFLSRMGQVGSVHELESFIKDNWAWFYHNGAARGYHKTSVYKPHVLLNVSLTELHFGDQSNSHSSPRGPGFGQNWGGLHSSLPRSYPGWQARLNFVIRTPQIRNRYAASYGPDHFYNTLIDPVGGHGGLRADGAYIHSYSVTLWSDDFPVMENYRKQKLVIDKLVGE